MRLVPDLRAVIAQIDAGELAAAAVDIPIGLASGGPRPSRRRGQTTAGTEAELGLSGPGAIRPRRDELRGGLRPLAAASGKAISKQLFNILPKISEVDAVITPRRQRRLFEMCPELSLAVLAGAPMRHAKTTAAGRVERLDALGTAFGHEAIARHLRSVPRGAKADDLLDALPARGPPCVSPPRSTCSSAATSTSEDCAWKWWPDHRRWQSPLCLPVDHLDWPAGGVSPEGSHRCGDPSPARRKSRNCVTRMTAHDAAADRRHVLAVQVRDQLRLGELVLLAPGDQTHGTVGQGVAHPLGVGAVGEGEAEAVLRAEHVDGRPVDGPVSAGRRGSRCRARAPSPPRGPRPCS